MFSINKEEKQPPTYLEEAMTVFSEQNSFIGCLSQMRAKLFSGIQALEKDSTFKLYFYVDAIKGSIELITINIDTKEYAELLLETDHLISKVRSIVLTNSGEHVDYLLNSLVDVISMLKELDSSLQKRVPFDYSTIKETVSSIQKSLEEKLGRYYEITTKPLIDEMKLVEELRVEYQIRKKSLESN